MNQQLQDLYAARDVQKQLLIEKSSLVQDIESAGIPDLNYYKSVQNDITLVTQKYESLDKEIIELEGASTEAQEEVKTQFETFNYNGTEVSVLDLVKGEIEYDIIMSFIQGYAAQKAQNHLAIVNSYKGEVEKLKSEISELYGVSDNYEDTISNLRNDIHQLYLVKNDVETKRDAAVAQFEALQAEIAPLQAQVEQLKADNETLRKQLEQPKVEIKTNLTGGYEKRVPKKVYNLTADGKHYKANLLETGEVISISYYALGAYEVVEGEEIARFQQEQQLDEQIDEVSIEEVVTPQLEESSLSRSYPGVYTESVIGEVVEESEEVSEIEALAYRVSRIEAYLKL